MLPTFLQKRRATSSLRVGVALSILLIVTVVYSLGLSYVIAHRTFTQSNKLLLIVVLLVTALAVLGVLERIRR